MPDRDHIAEFVERLARYDGYRPFSDAKLPLESGGGSVVLVTEEDSVVGMGAVASHRQSDGTVHVELETAVQPGMRFPAFERAVLDASLPLVHGSSSFSVWSNRSSLDTALIEGGFSVIRVLDYLVVALPLSLEARGPNTENLIRTFRSEDIDGILSVNRAAFAGHREAASLDTADFAGYMSEATFDPDGFLIADVNGCAGFCWTKVHGNGDGEIFRIAVSPDHRSSGIGFALLKAGFDYLADRPDVRRGVLWVDRSNDDAMRLYTSTGMVRERSIREFRPA
jgi:mycothiol synthase